MMKAICFEDVRPGDVVCRKVGRSCTVGALSIEQDPYIQLFTREEGFVMGRPGELIGLLHRPWPEGKTEGDMWREVMVLVSDLYGQNLPSLRALGLATQLREAIEAYELGKPLEEPPDLRD